MTVYVVMDGYEDKIGAFSSLDKAEAYINSLLAKYQFAHRDRYTTLAYTLDLPNE